jgi:fucose permease
MLSFASILAGGGYGGLVLYVNAAFADDNLILNGINAIFGTGAVAGPFAIGSAVHKETDFFMIIGIICIATLPVVFCIPESEMPEGAKNPTSERRFRVKSLIVFIPFALYALAYEGLETSVGAFESTHLTGLGIQTSVAARLTSLYWLGLAVGRFVLPWFMRRMSPYSIVVTSLSACTIILPVALLPGAAPYAYASCGFAIAPTFPAALRWMATQVESPRRATATVLISGMAGGSLIPIIISVLIRAYGWPLIPLALTGVAGTCLLAAVSAKFSSTQLKMKINGPPQ